MKRKMLQASTLYIYDDQNDFIEKDRENNGCESINEYIRKLIDDRIRRLGDGKADIILIDL